MKRKIVVMIYGKINRCDDALTFPRFFVFQEAVFMLPVFPAAER